MTSRHYVGQQYSLTEGDRSYKLCEDSPADQEIGFVRSDWASMSQIVSTYDILSVLPFPSPTCSKNKNNLLPLTQGLIRLFPCPQGLMQLSFVFNPNSPSCTEASSSLLHFMQVFTVSMRMLGVGVQTLDHTIWSNKHNEVILISHGPRYGNRGRKMLVEKWSVRNLQASNLFKLERDNLVSKITSRRWRDRAREREHLCANPFTPHQQCEFHWIVSLCGVKSLRGVCDLCHHVSSRMSKPTPVCILVSVRGRLCPRACVCLGLVTLEPVVLSSNPDPCHLSAQITHARTHAHARTHTLAVTLSWS